MNKHLIPSLIAAATSVALVTGCSDHADHQHSHADHGAEAASADHSTMDHGTMAHDTAGAGAEIAADSKPYPLTTCVVSGEELGSMGEPERLVYEGQEMKFCCKDCVERFQADPDQYLEKLAAAVAKPMEMPIQGGEHSGH